MKPYTIKEPIAIPYFDHDHKSLKNTIENSSSRRNMTKWHFIKRKVRNILLNRWAYTCPLNGWRVKMHKKRGVTIGDNVYIGQYCTIDNAYPEYIYIEDNVSLAGHVTVLAHSNPYPHFKNIVESAVEPVVIKEGAWIADGVIILKGVTIGKNAIVSAGTVVDKNVPDCCLAQGNPMKILTNFTALID